MTLFQNKYRIETTRAKDWDYSNPWWYYVTINTKDHIECFGKIIDGKMVLNELGKIAEQEWNRTKTIRNNVDLYYFVIMPNHIHGIIIINESVKTTGSVVSNKTKQEPKTTQRVVSTTLKPNSLGSIIEQFKTACSKRIRSLGKHNFAWQPRFYDRIIRNEKELYNIRKYIEQNPLKCEFEKNQSENIFAL